MKISSSAGEPELLLLERRELSHMLFMRVGGEELSAWRWRGGVGCVLGRAAEAAFRRAEEGERDVKIEEDVGEGGDVGAREEGRDGGWEWRPRMWIASLEDFSRSGNAVWMGMWRTSVGEPWGCLLVGEIEGQGVVCFLWR